MNDLGRSQQWASQADTAIVSFLHGPTSTAHMRAFFAEMPTKALNYTAFSLNTQTLRRKNSRKFKQLPDTSSLAQGLLIFKHI